jgi:hypothetical protein
MRQGVRLGMEADMWIASRKKGPPRAGKPGPYNPYRRPAAFIAR